MTRALVLALGAMLAIAAAPIDRKALVDRHAPAFTAIDPHAPAMLGNGSLGFTADITGLQTFPERYAPTAPLLTMAQWAWHSFPNPAGYSARDGLVPIPVPGRGTQPYAYMRDLAETKKRPALAWLRENPHRFSLGGVRLALTDRTGRRARFEDLSDTRQRLDLWRGVLVSSFRFDGQPVEVETRVDPRRDVVVVAIRSPLVAAGRVGVEVAYPGVARTLNPDPSDFTDDASHRTDVVARAPGTLRLRNTIDETRYDSSIVAPGATVGQTGAHVFRIGGTGARLVASISFDRRPASPPRATWADVAAATDAHWRDYWSSGGAIDFTGSTDPRARELERRVVLSRYLASINEAGDVPPQEEGLFSNSWNGKFHLEMTVWHSAHFAAWGQPALMERGLGWYLGHLDEAKAEARRHRVEGAWWPKMSGPEGRNSPSPINPFIMWQQPHAIYLAEMARRAKPAGSATARYGELVEQTAHLLATWPRLDPATGTYRLGPPIIPVQETHDPFTTVDPAFELEYFRWALQVAQDWRVRRGLAPDAGWAGVIAGMARVPEHDGLYLPVATAPDFWAIAGGAACRAHVTLASCPNRDHPSFLMPLGTTGSDRIDRATMARTLAAVDRVWDAGQLWGWDFPMIAMTAARLGRADEAIDWLFKDAPNNRWGTTGMTPRFDISPTAAASPGGPPRVADTYFPSNGSLLLAVGMMAAGWDGSRGAAPGFPRKGWTVRVEGITPLP